MEKKFMYQPPIEDSDKKIRNDVAKLADQTGRRRGSIAKQAIQIGISTLNERCATGKEI